MTDLNSLVEALVDEISARVYDKVEKRLTQQFGKPWPDVETSEPEVETKEKPFVRTVDKVLGNPLEEALDKIGEATDEPETSSLFTSTKDERREHYKALTAPAVRELLMEAEGLKPADFKGMSKADLVERAVNFELLTGKHLDDDSDDPGDEVVEPEAEPEDEVVEPSDEGEDLTYDQALKLDLAELKQIALDSGFEADELKGLDVDAVVDLLFSSDDELELDDLLDMPFDSLVKVAEQLGVEYDENISRPDLAQTIYRQASE